MKRVALTDQSGKWFDEEKAIAFKEETRWDGRNNISVPTGSQWEHEELLYTKSGNWIKHEWSHTKDVYSEIGTDEASRWLVVNCHCDGDKIKQLPQSILAKVVEVVASLEV